MVATIIQSENMNTFHESQSKVSESKKGNFRGNRKLSLAAIKTVQRQREMMVFIFERRQSIIV